MPTEQVLVQRPTTSTLKTFLTMSIYTAQQTGWMSGDQKHIKAGAMMGVRRGVRGESCEGLRDAQSPRSGIPSFSFKET